jgi:hypothetical protein
LKRLGPPQLAGSLVTALESICIEEDSQWTFNGDIGALQIICISSTARAFSLRCECPFDRLYGLDDNTNLVTRGTRSVRTAAGGNINTTAKTTTISPCIKVTAPESFTIQVLGLEIVSNRPKYSPGSRGYTPREREGRA